MTNTLAIVSNPTTDQQITYVVETNTPLLNQLVGASTPLLGTENLQLTAGGTELNGIQLSPTNVVLTLGMTNQWHFYVVTNTGAADFTNAAFITFIPDTLAIPRMGVFAGDINNATRPEADIDLYVSADPNLMNLYPDVISNADKSVGRGGVEFVYYTNSVSVGKNPALPVFITWACIRRTRRRRNTASSPSSPTSHSTSPARTAARSSTA